MAFGDSSLGVFFGVLAVPVVFGTQSTRGNLDEAGATGSLMGLTVEDSTHALEVARGSLVPMPKVRDQIVVDGRPFTVRNTNPIDDGAIIRLELKRA